MYTKAILSGPVATDKLDDLQCSMNGPVGACSDPGNKQIGAKVRTKVMIVVICEVKEKEVDDGVGPMC